MKMLKIAAKGLAGIALAALLAVNVQVGTPNVHAKTITVPKANADFTVTCGTDYAQDCFYYNDGINYIHLRGGVKNIQVE